MSELKRDNGTRTQRRRCEFPDRCRLARRGADRYARRQIAEGACLNQQIAEHRGLDRTGEHAASATISEQLIQKVVQRAAAYHVDNCRVNTSEGLELLDRRGVTFREAL